MVIKGPRGVGLQRRHMGQARHRQNAWPFDQLAFPIHPTGVFSKRQGRHSSGVNHPLPNIAGLHQDF
jgi:hypothetical protein